MSWLFQLEKMALKNRELETVNPDLAQGQEKLVHLIEANSSTHHEMMKDQNENENRFHAKAQIS